MYRKRATLFLISVILLALLFYSLDFDKFFEITSSISIGWFVMLVFIQLVTLFLMSARWYIVIRRYGVSLLNVVQTSMIGFMVNNLTPMSLAGGEPIRAYVISKIDNIKIEKAFATVFVDLFISLVPALAINLIAVILVFKNSLDVRLAWILAIIGFIIIALFGAALGIIFSKDHSLRAFNKILGVFARVSYLKKYVRQIEEQVEELFSSFHNSIRTTITDKTTLFYGILLSSFTWILTLLRVYFIFLAVGVPIDFEIVVIVYAVLVTVSLLPILPGALGMWEWIGTGMFHYFGVSLEAAAAIVVIDRILFYWIPIALGGVSSIHVGFSIAKLMDMKD